MASLTYDLILIVMILIMGYSLIASPSSDTVGKGMESQNISVGDAMETVRTMRRGSSDSRLSLKDEMQAQAIEMADRQKNDAWKKIQSVSGICDQLEDTSGVLLEEVSRILEQATIDSEDLYDANRGFTQILQNLDDGISEGQSACQWAFDEVETLRFEAERVRGKNSEVRKWFNID